ncbi:hypothetical protein A5724_08800 [Mycobacterium sp. ACS1612]|nr:WhiB family transcriptional regulator [Mycobacterium sp. ACS1612]OBF39227.1 hypothetical protein A5724_08800 [Mycobacterium sp. ACS1612]
MIVTTINVNGVRAAIKQRSQTNLGLLPWLAETKADVVCLQETRADDDQLAAALAPALPDGWHLASAPPGLGGSNLGRFAAGCHGCAVLAQCRAWALSQYEIYGVWGGLSENDRSAIWKGRAPRRSYLRRPKRPRRPRVTAA